MHGNIILHAHTTKSPPEQLCVKQYFHNAHAALRSAASTTNIYVRVNIIGVRVHPCSGCEERPMRDTEKETRRAIPHKTEAAACRKVVMRKSA